MNNESKPAFAGAIALFKAIEPIRLYGDRMDMSAGELEWHVQEVDRLYEVAYKFLEGGVSPDLWTLLDAATWEAVRVSRECREHLDTGRHNIDQLWRDYRRDLEEQDHPD